MPEAKPRVSYAQFAAALRPTVAQLAERYKGAFTLSVNQIAHIHVIQRAPIGALVAEALTRNDYREHAVLRKNNEVPTLVRRKERAKQLSGATVGKDFGLLSVIFTHAKDYWDVPIDLDLLKQARRKLKKEKLIAKAKKRTRRAEPHELQALLAHFAKQNGNGRTKTDMVVVTEFSYEAGRRISETCRIQRKHVNLAVPSYWVYDLKNPNGKGMHHEFPLFGRMLEMVKERLALIPDDPEAFLFPFNSRTCSARYTLAKKQLGIKDLRLHDNRRLCFSTLLAAGMTVPQVQHGVSGHLGDAKTLTEVYTQITPAEVLAAVKRMQEQRAVVG